MKIGGSLASTYGATDAWKRRSEEHRARPSVEGEQPRRAATRAADASSCIANAARLVIPARSTIALTDESTDAREASTAGSRAPADAPTRAARCPPADEPMRMISAGSRPQLPAFAFKKRMARFTSQTAPGN